MDHKDPRRRLDDSAANNPVTHNDSLADLTSVGMNDDTVNLPDFEAPTALPSILARVLAFGAIIVAAVCGGLVGYAIAELQCTGGCGFGSILAGVAGIVIAAGGVSIISVLVLRAMAEWESEASVHSRK